MFIAADSTYRDAAQKIIDGFNENLIGEGGNAFLGSIYYSDDFKNEVIVGYVPQRPVSVMANRLMLDIPKSGNCTVARYAIYAEDGKIAISVEQNPYTSYDPVEELVNTFLEKYVIGKSTLLLEKGIIEQGYYDVVARQSELDEADSEQRWENVKQTIGNDDIYESFKSAIQTLFNDEIIPFLGDLYDPATGLFYSSRSGKAAEDIYPNIEATHQVLSYMANSGMVRNLDKEYFIPEVMKYRIVYYIKCIQEDDGEFYISQMHKSQIDSNRLGRDYSACINLLTRFNERPTYGAGSLAADGLDAEEYWSKLVRSGLVKESDKPLIYWADKNRAPITVNISHSDVAMVSKAVSSSSVVMTASGTEPFQSHEGFVRWLLERDPNSDPYTAMSATASAYLTIASWSEKLGEYEGENVVISESSRSFELKKGDTLHDVLLRWANSYINEAGLFGKVTNNYDSKGNPVYDGFFGGWGYQNSNGFLKGISNYTITETPYPEPWKAAESLLKGINSDEPATDNVLVIFNVWSALDNLRKNIEQFYEGEDKQELLDYIMNGLDKMVADPATGEERPYAAIAIDKCVKKILAFKKSDGGYGHRISMGTGTWQGSLPVGIPTDNLSDLDATNCSTAPLCKAIAAFYGLDLANDVPVYTETDVLRFMEVMLSQETVIKEDIKDEAPPTADPGEPAPEIEVFDSIPSHIKYMPVAGTKYTIEKIGENNVFLVNKEKSGFVALDYEAVNMTEEGANVAVISFDLKVADMSGRGGFEIYIRQSGRDVFLPIMGFDGVTDGSGITAYDHGSGNAASQTSASVGSWARIRIIYLKDLGEYDFYVNGKLVFTGNHLRSGADYPEATAINSIRLAMASANVGKFYFDNLYIRHVSSDGRAEQIGADLTGLPTADGSNEDQYDDITGPVGPDHNALTFDTMPEKIKISTYTEENSVSIAQKDENSVIHVDKPKSGYVSFSYAQTTTAIRNADAVIIGFDMLIENPTVQGGIETYLLAGGKEAFLPYFNVRGLTQGSDVYVYDHGSGKSDIPSGIKIGSWARVEFRYFPEDQEWDMYVDGNFVLTGSHLRKVDAYPSANELNGITIAIASANVGDYYFDNLYVNQLVGIKRENNNTEEDEDGLNTVEGAFTFDEIPSTMVSTPPTGVTVSLATKNGDGVLFINKPTSGWTAVDFKGIVSEREDGANASVFGFDMLFEGISTIGSIEVYLYAGDRAVFLPIFNIKGTGAGSIVSVYDCGTGGNGASEVPTGATVGSFARVEIVYYGSPGEYDLYVNGVFVMTGVRLRSGETYPLATEMSGIRIAVSSASVGKYYFDNLFLRHIAETPEEREERRTFGSADDVIDFDNIESADAQDMVKIYGGSTVSVVDKGEGDMALKIDKQSDGGAELTVTPQMVVPYADVMILEFDVLVENIKEVELPEAGSGESSTGVNVGQYIPAVEIYLHGDRTSMNNKKYLIYMRPDDPYDGSSFKFSDNVVGASAEAGKVGEWTHVKIVFYQQSSSYSLYVNDIFVFNGNLVRVEPEVIPAVRDLTKASIFLNQAADADVYFDNISLIKTHE